MLDVNDRHHSIQINDIDRESHAQSMNAVTGDNPEARAITEVTRAKSEKATEPGPMRIGYRKRGGEVRLAGLIEGLSLRGKNRHKYESSPSSLMRFALPSNDRRKPAQVVGTAQ